MFQYIVVLMIAVSTLVFIALSYACYMFISRFILLYVARISCYASPTTKNGGLHTPIVGK